MHLFTFLFAFALGASLTGPASGAEQSPTPEQEALIARYQALGQSLRPQRGDVGIAAASATLHLGNQYYFLPADDAKRVLVEGWGNPTEVVDGVLGMIFTEGTSFIDDTWGAVLTYSPDGYVSDADANSANYDDLLQEARSGEDEENAQRKADGLPVVHLVGWAQPPSYDTEHHALIWAREIQFGDEVDNTLNYDIRTLGRRGILSINLVSTMSKLGEVRAAANALQQVASFDNGARYADYQPGTDATAGYGLAGLVAAGLGAAAAKKLGLLAIAILFLKKFAFVFIALFAGVAAWIRRLVGGKEKDAARDLRSS